MLCLMYLNCTKSATTTTSCSDMFCSGQTDFSPASSSSAAEDKFFLWHSGADWLYFNKLYLLRCISLWIFFFIPLSLYSFRDLRLKLLEEEQEVSEGGTGGFWRRNRKFLDEEQEVSRGGSGSLSRRNGRFLEEEREVSGRGTGSGSVGFTDNLKRQSAGSFLSFPLFTVVWVDRCGL